MAVSDKLAKGTRTLLSPVPDPAESVEVYRQIFVSLDLTIESRPVIGVTSAIGGEGRTTIAMGLARTLATDRAGRVALVEVDIDHPSLAQRFAVRPSPGLSEVLRGESQIEDVMCSVADNLVVVPAGASGSDPSRLFRELSNRDSFHDQSFADVVILDLPPIMDRGYSAFAAAVADVLIFVVRAGVTPISIVREAIVRLEDRPPRGIVFNGARSSLPSWWPSRDL